MILVIPVFTIRAEQMAALSPPNHLPVVMPCDRHWIEIVLIDEDEQPVPGAAYEVRLPDGSALRGSLNDNGCAWIKSILAGTCEVTFPERDIDSWKRL
jgi:hypothetical protein